MSGGDLINILENNKFGIALEGRKPKTEIILDFPAPYDREMTEEFLQARIAEGVDEDGKYQNQLEYIKAFRGAKVLHASGNKLNENGHRLDWALVQWPDQSTNPSNTPPSRNQFPTDSNSFTYRKTTLMYNVGHNETITEIGTWKLGEWVAKQGRTTNVTVGEINGFSVVTPWRDGDVEMETEEVQILPWSSKFAQGGDSGSLIFNLKKQWVGIVWGSQAKEDSSSALSASEIVADIKNKTGGTITLV